MKNQKESYSEPNLVKDTRRQQMRGNILKRSILAAEQEKTYVGLNFQIAFLYVNIAQQKKKYNRLFVVSGSLSGGRFVLVVLKPIFGISYPLVSILFVVSLVSLNVGAFPYYRHNNGNQEENSKHKSILSLLQVGGLLFNVGFLPP